jgi:E3 ubiquitin-protein ligase HUWE1
VFEPDLIQTLVSHIGGDQNMEVQFAALSALDSISHFRTRLNETLSALNVGANHGVLMQLMRKIVASFVENVASFSQDFVDSYFSFVSFLINTSSGGQMIISAGLLTLLTNAISSCTPMNLKYVSKCAIMIDTVIYGFPSSLNVFTTIGGVNIVVNRIADEIKACLEIGEKFTKKELEVKHLDPGASSNDQLLSARIPLLRSLLKLILHLLQSSGSADGMRNLIDSSLPKSIYQIFERPDVFGHVGAFGLAVNIMSTFVHNEPTSLPILQEAQLPQSFLRACQLPLSISAEVISALPNAFGAICLNATGLEMFEKNNPIDVYLSTFMKQDHLKTLLDNDVAHLIGNSLDEFMRHHPTLKDHVMKSIIKLLESILQLGNSLDPIPNEFCHLLTETPTLDTLQESRMALYIDVTSCFLEGLFQNPAHCKEFCKSGGIPLLLSLFTLPTIPYDFAESPSSYSLSYLFRVIIESSSQDAVSSLVSSIQTAFINLKPAIDSVDSHVLYDYIYLEDKSDSFVAEAQKAFSALISLKCLIRLLADLYCSHSLSHSRSLNAIIHTFSSLGSDLLREFAKLKTFLFH